MKNPKLYNSFDVSQFYHTCLKVITGRTGAQIESFREVSNDALGYQFPGRRAGGIWTTAGVQACQLTELSLVLDQVAREKARLPPELETDRAFAFAALANLSPLIALSYVVRLGLRIRALGLSAVAACGLRAVLFVFALHMVEFLHKPTLLVAAWTLAWTALRTWLAFAPET